MPTREQLETALRNADAAGDVEAAKVLASALRSAGAQQTPSLPAQNQAQRRAGTDIDEAILTMASGAIAEPLAGLAGIVQSINPFEDEGAGARAVEATREALTFQPRTAEGQQRLEGIAETVAPATEAFAATEDTLGDFAFDLTGSPAIAAAAKSTPTALMELLGLRALGGVKRGTKLLDNTGAPTPALRKVLKKQGLEFENLSDSARAVIPQRVEGAILPAKSSVKGTAETALVKQIQSGASDNALAGLKVIDGRVVPDRAGLDAVKQGFREGTVQNAKIATPETKLKMREMLKNKRRIMANEKLESVLRPSNVAGDSVIKRLDLVRKKANDARLKLNDIAVNQLAGKKVDGAPIVNKLTESLNNLDVRLLEGANGIPVPDFKGSIISKNRPAQRVIKDAIDLMSEGGTPDALRFHKLKRQLDDMIDFKKKGAQGLSKAGEGVLKDLRAELNNSVRAVSPEYAKVNDILSSSLDMFDNLQKSAGTSIDLFGQGGGKALGTRLRSLMSNQQNRINLENSLSKLDDVAKNLGGRFNDDIGDLVRFANALDDRFGATARTSFRGDIEAANVQSLRGGVPRTAFEAAAAVGEKGLEKLRGVNDFSAFNAMDDLLKGKK
jgi:hypothetical protein